MNSRLIAKIGQVIIVAFVFCTLHTSAKESKKPNIIVIYTDDQAMVMLVL